MLHYYWFIFCVISAGIICSFVKFDYDKDRIGTLDSLRFVLATMVAFHHNLFSNNFFSFGKWTIDNPTIGFIGGFGVGVFFMISGYLFGDLKKDTDWIVFFIKRALRIAPVCILSSLACVIISIIIGVYNKNAFSMQGIFYWFDIGITNIRPPVYGVWYSYLINAGVTWTLVWEWLFYFSIPALTLMTNKKNRSMICVLLIAWLAYFGTNYNYTNSAYIILFCIGVLFKTADLSKLTLLLKRCKFIFEVLLIISLIGTPIIFDNPMKITSIFFGSLSLLLVICGCNLFGLLNNRGFRILGDASYSIYLLHGIFWFLMNSIAFKIDIQNNKVIYYSLQTITWYLICFVSIFCYKYIESPFIKIGKRIK